MTESSINHELSNIGDKRVAIVHDWLVGGGAEKVIEQLHLMFPEAPIYTSYATDKWRQRLDDKVVTGYLQKWPFSSLRKFLPLLRQRWFKKLDLSGFDLIISSSGNGEAKFITKPSGATHMCYCHTPTHFYWRHYATYLKNPGFGVLNPIARIGLKMLVRPLKKKDFRAAQKVDYFIANSRHIAHDIKKYYKKNSVVVAPPVSVQRISSVPEQKRSGIITVGRLVPNKRVDLIIRACDKQDVDLTIIGRGPELQNLKKIAGSNVRFLTSASDKEVALALASSEGFVFAGFEDFGIAPVEALAAGTPVIAYRRGGALDYVAEGKTGTFFDDQTAASLATALASFKSQKYNHGDIKKAAEKFSDVNFRKNLRQALNRILQ